MFLAHARGLLKPDYPNGIRSVVREELILRQIEREIEGEVFMARAQIESAVISVSARKDQTYDAALGFLRQAGALKKFSRYRRVRAMGSEQQKDAALREEASVFKILKNSDLFAMMDRILEKEGL